MAKKEIIAFDPPTEEEIMLIQPNNVTFGQYNVSEWQENLLTLIGDKIQKHMTREEELPRDLFNQPYVVIMCDEAGGKNNKNKVLKEAIDMLNKRFSFRWLHPKMKKEIETTGGSVITNIHNIKGTNQIMVNLNPWAIPFLIYYGVGVGGTLKVLHSDFGVTTQNGFIKSFAANEIEENITTLYLNSEKT